jgi:hypothetical protein
LVKLPNIKINETPSSGSVVAPCRQIERRKDRDRQTDMIKVVVAFYNFAREPKMNPSRLLPFEF